MASIRGHQTQVKMLKSGQPTGIVNLTRFDVNQDGSFMRSHYVGAALPEGDQSQEGWSGTMECEVKGPEVDNLIDVSVTQNLSGVGVDEISIVDTENYPDGRSRTYVYFDVQVKMSKSQPGGTEKVTKRLDWQASGRIPL
jgi:hypothetical protein